MKDEKLFLYFFMVEIDKIQIDRFLECEGLEMESTVFMKLKKGVLIYRHTNVWVIASLSDFLCKYNGNPPALPG